MSADLFFSFAWLVPCVYFLASLVLFVLMVRVRHTYLGLKVRRERMHLPSELKG